jgi:NADH-quinone oxidoreductase subunit A
MASGGTRTVADTLGSAAAQVAITDSQNLWPFVVYAMSVVALLAIVLIASWFIGSRTKHKKATDMPFESGIVPVGSAEQTRLSIEFYLIAMFFVIFDLETIFIFAWAVAFYELGWRGYLGASVFIVILLVALIYELRTGALDWGNLGRRSRPEYAIAPGATLSSATVREGG